MTGTAEASFENKTMLRFVRVGIILNEKGMKGKTRIVGLRVRNGRCLEGRGRRRSLVGGANFCSYIYMQTRVLIL